MSDDTEHNASGKSWGAQVGSRREFIKAGALAGAAVLLSDAHAAETHDPKLLDEKLLDDVQRATLNYFLDPPKNPDNQSGMALERSNSEAAYGGKTVVTTGGTGFGIMAMIAGVKRGWVDRDTLVNRAAQITAFLGRYRDNLSEHGKHFNGVFPHLIDAATAKIYNFPKEHDSDDIVETSYLMMGLLSARQYLRGNNEKEKHLRQTIDDLYAAVDWNSHVHNGKLYWHHSSDPKEPYKTPIEGWNECLVTYVLAAASKTHPIPKDLYENSWARGDEFRNGQKYYGIELPLGPPQGGPMFLSHYSFMGLCPWKLKDDHVGDYWKQVTAHTQINRAYCIANPNKHKGYGEKCWGLSSCDVPGDYTDCSPSNDPGIIAPTAAISSLPYAYKESMEVLRDLYKKDPQLWDDHHGFVDSFKADGSWYSGTRLAIDQAPIVAMIENYRSGLLWGLFMSCPEVQDGLKQLKFESPYMQKTTVDSIAGLDPAKAAEKLHEQFYQSMERSTIPVSFPSTTPTSLTPVSNKIGTGR